MPLLNKSFLSENLDDEGMNLLAGVMQYETFRKSETIIKYGDLGDKYYLLAKGSVKVVVYEQGTDPNDKMLENHRIMIKYMCEGQGFGELSIVNNKARSATIIAVDDNCELYSLDASIFKAIISFSNYERKISLANSLNRVTILNMYDDFFKIQLADSLKVETYGQNQCLFREGDQPDAYYMILEGSIECLKYYEDDKKSGYIRVRDLRTGDHFGEVALMTKSLRSMTTRVTSATCTVAVMTKEVFFKKIFLIEGQLKKDYNSVFDTKLRDILNSENASDFPLNQVFLDYHLKYIKPLAESNRSKH